MPNSPKDPLDEYNALSEEMRTTRERILLLLDKANIDITVAVASNEPFKCMQIRSYILSLMLQMKEDLSFPDKTIHDDPTCIEDFRDRYVRSDSNYYSHLN